MVQISSLHNPLIREVLKLEKSRERKKSRIFTAEGLRECRLAIEGGFNVAKILFCSNRMDAETLQRQLNPKNHTELVDVSDKVFDALVYRKGLPNCLALIEMQEQNLSTLPAKPNPLYLIIDSVEKPGNLGAMLRTCDAAGIDGVMVCDPNTDLYNPNCIRASLGAVFTLPVITVDISTCIQWLRAQKIATCVTYLEAASVYSSHDFTVPTAFVMGSEAHGIRSEWLNHGFQHIIIPQFGKVDSMNVANSAAILIYEALRQRGFPSHAG